MPTPSTIPSRPHRPRTGPSPAHLRLVLALFAAMAAMLGWGRPAAAEGDSTLTWSVRPVPTADEPDRPNFVFTVVPGTTLRDTMRVTNYAPEPLQLDVYASDAVMTASGSLDLLPAGEQPTGVGAWVALDTVAIVVPAGGSVDVPFAIAVPPDAEPGDHAGGIVTSFRSPGTDDSGRPVVLDRRLGSRVHLRVEGDLRPGLTITGLDADYAGTANPAGTGTMRVTYRVTNTGNVRAGAALAIDVGGRFGLRGRTVTPDPITELLPGASRDVTVEVADVWPTVRPTVRATAVPVPVRPGDVFDPATPAATATATVWALPWSALAACALLVAVPVSIRRRRRARRAREAAVVEQAVADALAAAASATGATDAPGATGQHAAPVGP